MKKVWDKWTRIALVKRILVGLILGAILGIAVPQATGIAILGDVFVSALKAIAPLLVFFLVISSLCNAGKSHGGVIKTVIILYMFSTVLAAVIAVFASMAFPVKMTLANAATDTSAPQGIVEVLNNLLLNVVANPVSSLVNANYVGILMWAVLLGLAFRAADKMTKKVLADDNATQAEVDAQVEAVNAAKAALEEKKAPVVKEELEKAVADATEVVGATDKYTEASLAALQSAIDAANEVLQNSDATQDEIDAAVQAVKEARAALKAKDDDKKDDSNKDDDKKDDNNGSDNNGVNNNGNANNGSNNNGSFNNGSSNNGTANGTSNVAKAAKTGDTSNVAGMAMLCLAAGLVVVMAKRRRTN